VPSWGEILGEVQRSAEANNGKADFDGIRRRYIANVQTLTGRDTIVYYSDWLGGSGPGITLIDMQGMMEVCRGLHGPNLNLVIHSPGGSAEATASIVSYLRQRYTDMRVYVPLAAMSAATMWALAADRIVMGAHSQLGPIDPQLLTPQGAIPARAILDQFERAKAECSADPSLLGAWAPILQQYGPALIEQCNAAEKLSRRLVRQWLKTYMFSSTPDPARAADRAVKYFASFNIHRSHSLGISRDDARAKGIIIDDLEADQTLQDAVLSVHHASICTLSMTPTVKLIENHLGRAFMQQQQAIPLPFAIPGQPPPDQAQSPATAPPSPPPPDVPSGTEAIG
jgi:hypothetical protein